MNFNFKNTYLFLLKIFIASQEDSWFNIKSDQLKIL